MDLYLKFADEAEANSFLYTEVSTEWNEEGEPTAWASKPNYANIDILGTLYEPVVDPEATPVAPVALDGYHVNVRVVAGEDEAPLLPFSITPAAPRRIWG